jgi:hypothetical protein
MKRRDYFYAGIIGIMLIFVFFTIDCDNGTNSETDTWSVVKSADELIGNWKGSGTIDIPKNDEQQIPATSFGFTVSLSYPQGSSTISGSTKVDCETFLEDSIKSTGQTPSTLLKKILWENYKAIINASFPDAGYTFGNYYIIIEQDIAVSNFTESEQLQINQNRTKLKMIITKEDLLLTGITGMDEDIEIILNKE